MTLVLKPLSKFEFIAECESLRHKVESFHSNNDDSELRNLYFSVGELSRQLGDNNTFFWYLITTTVRYEARYQHGGKPYTDSEATPIILKEVLDGMINYVSEHF